MPECSTHVAPMRGVLAIAWYSCGPMRHVLVCPAARRTRILRNSCDPDACSTQRVNEREPPSPFGPGGHAWTIEELEAEADA